MKERKWFFIGRFSDYGIHDTSVMYPTSKEAREAVDRIFDDNKNVPIERGSKEGSKLVCIKYNGKWYRLRRF